MRMIKAFTGRFGSEFSALDATAASHIANLGQNSQSKDELLGELAELLFQRKIEIIQDRDT